MHWLSWFDALNLIDAFNYYLIFVFLVGLGINFRKYRSLLGMVMSSPNRWPKLLELLKKHRTIFLGWPIMTMIGISFLMMVSNFIAIHFIWVQAQVSVAQIWTHKSVLLAVLILGSLMLFLDSRAAFRGSSFDRISVEKDLDKAESWLKSWMAPAVSIATFGFINPRKIVGVEVHRLLMEANWMMIGGLGRSSLRIAVQMSFGLSLWLSWAVGV
jgi:hypothetical protein